MRIGQTGVAVEILGGEVGRTGASAPTSRLVSETLRISYVKYSTGANETTCTAYRALGKPDSTAARRAFLAGCIIVEWHAEAKCFFRRVSAISRLQRLFFAYFFLTSQKKVCPRSESCAIRRRHDMACGTLCRQRTLSPVRLQVVHPVIFASANCPSRQSGPLMRTSRPPSVRAVSSSPSLPSTSTRIVLPT